MILGWLVSSNAALFVGMFVGLGGFGINWYYRHKADKRHEAAERREAFQLRAQLYFTRTRYVRVNLGWKLGWAADRVQLATHINPFRKWSLAHA